MMDLGMDFDDSLFEGEKVRNVDSAKTLYKAKIYTSEWFEGELEGIDSAEEQSVHKYRAELAYRKESYADSLRHYTDCFGLITVKNCVTWRDVVEGMCRCCLALGKHQQAISLARQLHDSSITFEHKTSSWMLLAKVYRHMGHLHEEKQTLQVLSTMHPLNPDFWLRLGIIHSSLSSRQSAMEQNHDRTVPNTMCAPAGGDSMSCDTYINNVDDTLSKQDCATAEYTDELSRHRQFSCACLQRARILLCTVQNTVVTFDKSCNKTQQLEIAEKIKQLDLPDTVVQQCAKMTEREVFRKKDKPDEDSETDSADTNALVKLTTEEVSKTFDQKWFFGIIDGSNNR